MKQRVAIVRALAWNPPILLMDEPFSALDELTRGQLQDDLLQMWNRERKTILFVTHNISEAIYLADRVVVMSPHPGRIKTDPVARAAASAHRGRCRRRPSSSAGLRTRSRGAASHERSRSQRSDRLRDDVLPPLLILAVVLAGLADRRQGCSTSRRGCCLRRATSSTGSSRRTNALVPHRFTVLEALAGFLVSAVLGDCRCRPASCIPASSSAACSPT